MEPFRENKYKHLLCSSVSELFVDNPGESSERIPVYIKISLPRLKCDCKLSVHVIIFKILILYIANIYKDHIFKELNETYYDNNLDISLDNELMTANGGQSSEGKERD